MMDNIPIPVQTLERYGVDDEREQLLRDAGFPSHAHGRDSTSHSRHGGHARGRDHESHGPEDEEDFHHDMQHINEEDGELRQQQQIVSDAAIEEAMMEAVKRRRLMEGGSMGRADADWVDEPPKKSKQTGRSYWVPSIDKWHEDFGHVRVSTDPVHPSPLECFGCGYEDTNSEANAIYAEKWNRLLTKFTECCANSSSPAVMARDLHDLFVRDFVSQMVTDNIENAHVIARNWTPYKMLYHMFFHNRDTNIAASNKIAWLHELQRTIVENELYKEHAVTGRRKVCKKGLKKLDTALKMELPWVKLKPDEMGFSVPRRQVNPNSISLLSSRVKQIEASRLARYNNPWK